MPPLGLELRSPISRTDAAYGPARTLRSLAKIAGPQEFLGIPTNSQDFLDVAYVLLGLRMTS